MNALSLFSGIAGLDLAIAPIARCRLYCDSDAVCKEILRKRMRTGDLEKAPIHEDVRTLDRAALTRYIGKQHIDIITAGKLQGQWSSGYDACFGSMRSQVRFLAGPF